jgi:hypothetical protein
VLVHDLKAERSSEHVTLEPLVVQAIVAEVDVEEDGVEV